jgi:hypothetical protein
MSELNIQNPADVIDPAQPDTAQAARVGFFSAAETDPQTYAEMSRLAKIANVPVDSVLQSPKEIKKQVALDSIDFDSLAKTSPSTASVIADIDKAKITHDDINNMTGLEEIVSKSGKSFARGARSLAAGLLYDLPSGVMGVGETGARLLAPLAEPLAGTILPENPLLRIAEGFKGLRQSGNAWGNIVAGDQSDAGWIEQAANSGVRSVGQNIPGMVASFLTENPAFMLGSAGMMSGSQAATKALDMGKTPAQAAMYGFEDATAEVVTEAIPTLKLLKDLKLSAPFWKLYAGQVATEVPSEMAATAWQNFNEWANLHPEQTFKDYAKALPEAEAQTVVSTLVATMLTSGFAKTAHAVINRGQKRDDQLAQAQDGAQQVQKINQLAQESKVIPRDNELFQDFVTDAADRGSLTHLNINANALLQSGMAEQLAQVSPTIAEQINLAAQTGGDIAVPIGEYSTKIAPLKEADGLVDLWRLPDNERSLAEEQEYYKTRVEGIQQEVENAIQGKGQQAKFDESLNNLRAKFTSEMNALGHHTPDIVEAQVTPALEWYRVTSKAMGLTPEELHQLYPLNFASELAQGEGVLNQGKPFDSTKLVEFDKFKTGQPVTFDFIHNTESATKLLGKPKKNAPYGRFIEPSGRYVSEGTLLDSANPNMISGQLTFNNPLVLNVDSWKQDLFDHYGKRGKALSKALIADGFDGVVTVNKDDRPGRTYISEILDLTTFDEAKALDALKQRGVTDIKMYERGNEEDRAAKIQEFQHLFFQQKRGAYNTESLTITQLKDANLSTFLHETGHFFLEANFDIASKLSGKTEPLTPGEQRIVDDAQTTLNWFGVPDLNAWYAMDFEQRRGFHEQFAEGFETYLFEGKAPSMQLQGVFNRFRAWLTEVYKSLKNMRVQLTPEVRGVFDRMLATDEEIDLARKAQSMFPLLERGDMSPEEFAAYQAQGQDDIDEAKAELGRKAARNMQWLDNAKSKALRKLQKQHDAIRREVRAEVRLEVLAKPIYQAYTALTAKITDEDKIAPLENRKSDPNVVDPATDNLATAIAKLGGLNKEEVMEEWGVDPAYKPKTGVFGKSVFRRGNNGYSREAMAEMLSERGYLRQDQHGKHDLREFEEKLDNQLRGMDQYSTQYVPGFESQAGDQVGNPAALKAMRLNIDGLAQSVDWPTIDVLKHRRMTSATSGLHPDLVADLFGFGSGEELAHKLAEATPPKEAIEALTDARMLEQYGDLSTPEALNKAALMAIHNDLRVKFLATEHDTLAAAIGQKKVLTEQAKILAETTIARKKVRDVQPSQFTAAEARNAKAAEKAKKSGDIAQAAVEKRNQIFNALAAKAAMNAREEVDKGIRRLKRLQSAGSQSNMRGEFLAQLNALMARFDIRTSLSLKSIDQARTPLATWVQNEAERLAAVTPDLPDFILDESVKTHYKNLTVEQFRGLMDTIKQLEMLARREEKQYQAIRNQTFAQEKAAALESIRQTNPGGFDGDDTPIPADPKFVPKLSDAMQNAGEKLVAELVNPENIIDVIENGRMGALWESIFGRMSHASDAKALMYEKVRNVMKPFFDAYTIQDKIYFSTKGIYVPEIGTSITRENAVVTALLWGSMDGRNRLQNYGWGPGQAQAIMAHLQDKDINLVNAIWDLFDNQLWPQLKALNEETRGKAPPKIEAAPFTLNGRILSGGYFRLKYDTELDERAHTIEEGQAVTDLLGGSMGMAKKTNQGTSTERLDKVTMRPRLDLGVFAETVGETLHDLAYRKAVADTIRMLNDRAITTAIKGIVGTPGYRALVGFVSDAASPPRNPAGVVEKTLSAARKNTVINMMSGVKTALQNFTGLVPALTKVGPANLTREVFRFYSPSMLKHYNFVIEQSDFMRNYFHSFDREVSNMARQLTVSGSLRPDDSVFLSLMTWVNKGTATPVWMAAFKDGMEKFNNDEAQATDYADRIVRQTQGSGRDVDLSEVMRGSGKSGEFKKLFTMFYSYFNAQIGQLVSSGAVSKRLAKKNPALAAARFARDYMYVIVIPTILTDLLMHGTGDDDEEELALRWAKKSAQTTGQLVPFFRDVSAYLFGKYAPDTKYHAGFRLSPIEGMIETTASAPGSAVDWWNDEETPADIKNIILGTGFVFRLPGKLVSDTVMGTNAWMEGSAGPEAVILGPPRQR